ncbi:hypothetical protein F0562_012728 [Nyssa sinensis]|uniref:Uncharacterized protein n=1 Tax=Nyssa sinensis TaxID=561372 RepID=A0A5J4ZWB6_9ASTE|nr:hypothetical protein F0562_012728 [Nyssa sinensis]
MSSTSMKSEAQGIKSARLLDLIIRDYTFGSYNKYFRTGMVHTVHLPANLSGIGVNAARFRCGSLRRYGAQVMEFHLGLLAYNSGADVNFSNPFELGIQAEKNPITIDFSNTTRVNATAGLIPLCASFERDGKVTLANQVSPNVCVVTGHGHFGLVIESPLVPVRKKVSRWKVAVGTSIGASLGAFLLGLLLIALLVKVKNKARMEEMERRAYEEEALQVSMVGHVRAPTAPVSRTIPSIEHELRPPPA